MTLVQLIYGEQTFDNGIIGNGNILNNLPGSANGNFYYVVVRDNNDPPCIVADWIDDPIAVYEPEQLEINCLLIFKKKILYVYYIAEPGTINLDGEGCNYNVSCPNATDGVITIEIDDLIGGDFPNADENNPNIPSEANNTENYTLQIDYQDGSNIGEWTGEEIGTSIEVPNLAAGDYHINFTISCWR